MFFSHETDGYNKKQVDSKIKEFMDEVTALKVANLEKDKLNYGLVNALEKSKEIEMSAKNLYDLKIQKIQILYKNLEKSFNTLFMLYPQLEELDNIKHLFDKFSKTVQTTYNEFNDTKPLSSSANAQNDTIHVLVDKINNLSLTNKTQYNTSVTIERKDKQISNNFDNTKSPADKFLEEGNVENSAYAKLLNTTNGSSLYPTPNESGFDLKEAVNPKQDLDEIMKAFNFDDE